MKINATQLLKLKMANMTYWKASYIDFHIDTSGLSQQDIQRLASKTIETLYECNMAMAKSAVKIRRSKSTQLKHFYLQEFTDNKGTMQYIIRTLGPDFSKELIESEYNNHSKESADFICKYIDFYKTQEQKKEVEYQKN